MSDLLENSDEGRRAREIVRLAAQEVEAPGARSWLLSDERGVWARLAHDLLKKVSDLPEAAGLPDREVNEILATHITSAALVTLALAHVSGAAAPSRGRFSPKGKTSE